MAILKNKIYSGVAGTVVLYELNGQSVMRSLPRKYKQTAATKARSKNFGMASRLAAGLIYPFDELMHLDNRNTTRARLAGAISRWMGTTPLKDISPAASIPVLTDFRFNPDDEFSSLSKRLFSVQAEVDKDIVLSIPEFIPAGLFIAPASATAVTCNIVALACNPAERWAYRHAIESIDIPLANTTLTAQEKILSLQPKAGELLLVATSLLFKEKKSELKLEKFQPADMIAAMYF